MWKHFLEGKVCGRAPGLGDATTGRGVITSGRNKSWQAEPTGQRVARPTVQYRRHPFRYIRGEFNVGPVSSDNANGGESARAQQTRQTLRLYSQLDHHRD